MKFPKTLKLTDINASWVEGPLIKGYYFRHYKTRRTRSLVVFNLTNTGGSDRRLYTTLLRTPLLPEADHLSDDDDICLASEHGDIAELFLDDVYSRMASVVADNTFMPGIVGVRTLWVASEKS